MNEIKLRKLSDVSWSERLTLCSEMSQESYFYGVDWIKLGKHFLSMFLGSKIWNMTFSEVLQALERENVKIPEPNSGGVHPVLDSSGTLTISINVKHDNETEFYIGLLQTFLSLCSLPRDNFNYLRDDAENLMRELLVQKSACVDKIRTLEGEKRTPEGSYELKKFKFYKERNEIVVDRLCFYMANEMKQEALALSTSSTYGITKLTSLGIMAKEANPNAVNDITNKFMHCTIPQLNQLHRIYKKRPIAFYRLSECWILKRAIPETTKLVKESHWFQGRADMVLRAFDFFNQREYQLTTAILALQIEGLMRDALVALGVDADDVSSESISSKAELLYKKNAGFYSYEYYKFRFPLLRNKIAHGDAHKTQREDAISTVLDFCAICKDIAQSDKIPVNAMVRILKSLETQGHDFAALLNYADLCVKNPQLNVPEFYNLSSVETFARETIRGKEFWDWMIDNPEKNYMPMSEIIKLGQKIGTFFNAKDQAQRHKDECLKVIASRKEDLARIKALLHKS